MTIPIVMLLLMTGFYLLTRLLSVVGRRDYDAQRAAAIGLALLFMFTSSGHFTDTESMAQMLPPWMPERVFLVYLTGVLELAIAVGFLVRKWRRATGWVTAAVLVLFFPLNIYAAINHVPVGGHAWGPV